MFAPTLSTRRYNDRSALAFTLNVLNTVNLRDFLCVCVLHVPTSILQDAESRRSHPPNPHLFPAVSATPLSQSGLPAAWTIPKAVRSPPAYACHALQRRGRSSRLLLETAEVDTCTTPTGKGAHVTDRLPRTAIATLADRSVDFAGSPTLRVATDRAHRRTVRPNPRRSARNRKRVYDH